MSGEGATVADSDASSGDYMPEEGPLFVNRTDELGKADQAEESARTAEERARIWLTGMAGMGKTALALRIYRRHRHRFPEGRLYCNLRGSTGAGLEVFEALGQLLRQSGVPDRDLPDSVRGREDMFRGLSRSRRLLLILDDAAGFAQLTSLLPPDGTSMVIVTSRRKFEDPRMSGFMHIEVGPFVESVSTDLLHQTVGSAACAAEELATRELVEALGGRPLALRVAAARIGRWRHRPEPVRSFVDALRSREALRQLHLDEELVVAATFDLTYAELTAAEASAYRLLALHPGPDFGTAVAGAMLDADPDEAGDLLYDLVNLGLLDRVSPGRFRFHLLPSEHARACALADTDESRREGASADMVAYYRTFVLARVRVLSDAPLTGRYAAEIAAVHTDDGARVRAAGELEQEYQNITAAFHLAVALGLHEEVATMSHALRNWLYNTDRSADLTTFTTEGLAAAERLADPQWLTYLLRDRATAYEKSACPSDDDFRVAVGLLQRARDRAGSSGDHLMVASTIEWEALLLDAVGRRSEARDMMEVALGVVRQWVTDPVPAARAIALLEMHIGRIEAALGHTEAAADHLPRAREYFERSNPWVNLSRLHLDLGRAAFAEDRFDDAALFLERAAEGFSRERFGSKELDARTLLAAVAERRGDREAERVQLRQALALAQLLGRDADVEGITRRLTELGD